VTVGSLLPIPDLFPLLVFLYNFGKDLSRFSPLFPLPYFFPIPPEEEIVHDPSPSPGRARTNSLPCPQEGLRFGNFPSISFRSEEAEKIVPPFLLSPGPPFIALLSSPSLLRERMDSAGAAK